MKIYLHVLIQLLLLMIKVLTTFTSTASALGYTSTGIHNVFIECGTMWKLASGWSQEWLCMSNSQVDTEGQ